MQNEPVAFQPIAAEWHPTWKWRLNEYWRKTARSWRGWWWGRVKIQEEDRIHEAWYLEARKINTPRELARFCRRLVRAYEHDYGTIIHALTAAAIGAAACMDHDSDQGGITGFQAGAVFWQFRNEWLQERSPARMLNFERMLFPQYQDHFEKIISPDTWRWLQEQAAEKLANENLANESVRAHWRSIAAGQVPFGYTVKDR